MECSIEVLSARCQHKREIAADVSQISSETCHSSGQLYILSLMIYIIINKSFMLKVFKCLDIQQKNSVYELSLAHLYWPDKRGNKKPNRSTLYYTISWFQFYDFSITNFRFYVS